MNKIAGFAVNNKIGTYKRLEIGPISLFNLVLPKDRKWDIGIDQSTTCTGLCLQDEKKEITVLCDLMRDTALPKSVFYADVFYLLKRLAEGQQIRMVIMEKPAPKAMMASRVLEELKGHVMEWVAQIPELRVALSDSVFQQTWKSYIVDKRKGKNRGKNKRMVAEDLVDRFPTLQPYLVLCPSKDLDSFDACGILNGFLEYAFTKEGDEKIHGTKEKTHVSLVGYQWVAKDNLAQVLEVFGDAKYTFKPRGLVYNDKFNLHDNVRVASSNYDCIYTVVPQRELKQFMWKFGIDPDDEEHYFVMYVLRSGHFKNSEVEYFKQLFPWNELIYSE